MTYVEMLKELLDKANNITELGRSMQMSPQKIMGLIDGTREWKRHDEKEVKSHYEMKQRVKAYSQRMQEFSL